MNSSTNTTTRCWCIPGTRYILYHASWTGSRIFLAATFIRIPRIIFANLVFSRLFGCMTLSWHLLSTSLISTEYVRWFLLFVCLVCATVVPGINNAVLIYLVLLLSIINSNNSMFYSSRSFGTLNLCVHLLGSGISFWFTFTLCFLCSSSMSDVMSLLSR